jgi:hypothetical protein
MLLAVALCIGGHLHQVVGQFHLHAHEEHGVMDGAEHHGSDGSDAAHFLEHHSAVAVVTSPFAFVPAITAALLLDDEGAQRLPDAEPRKVEQPPRFA